MTADRVFSFQFVTIRAAIKKRQISSWVARVYCSAQAELENLSAKLEPQKQSGLLWKPTILESNTTHTPRQRASCTHTQPDHRVLRPSASHELGPRGQLE